MKPDLIASLEALLASGGDKPSLRFALASRHLAEGRAADAANHAQAAVALDPKYSAAWKLLGQAHAQNGDSAAAIAAFEHGIKVAQNRGDQQAAKEMAVFLKRLLKGAAAPAADPAPGVPRG